MGHPAILLRRLPPYCARAVEGAASLCQTAPMRTFTPGWRDEKGIRLAFELTQGVYT